MDTPLLELRSISKSFPGVRALIDMSMTFRRAAVHVICGENGAGKSTLMKIVNGLHQPDSGEIWIDGKHVHVKSPIEARALGISMISQELNYIPEITVEEALFLGLEPTDRFGKISWPHIRERTKSLLRAEGLAYDPRTRLKDLSVSDIQMLEIMKAVSQQARIIIMDEPTSAITAKEVEILFAKIAALKAKGAAIIYISHRLDELFRIADDLSVIRDGTHVATRPAKDFTVDSVIQLMVGRSIENVFPPRPERRLGPTALEVTGLSDGEKFRDVDFHVRSGEIVGFSGLMGAGRTEVARAVFGLDPATAGAIRIKDAPVTIRSPEDGMKRGMAMLSEDRKRYGLVPVRDIKENVGLPSLRKFIYGGFLHKTREHDLVNPHSEGRRTAWQKEFFDKRPDVKILDTQVASWNKDEAMRHMEDWIQAHPQIDAVISMNDNMAAGAIEAIKAAGGKIHPLVYGVDGTAEACLLIKDGAMTSTTLQNANELAVRSVKMAHDILTGGSPDTHQMIQAKLYTKDNVDECIELHKSIGDIK